MGSSYTWYLDTEREGDEGGKMKGERERFNLKGKKRYGEFFG